MAEQPSPLIAAAIAMAQHVLEARRARQAAASDQPAGRRTALPGATTLPQASPDKLQAVQDVRFREEQSIVKPKP